MAARQHRRLFVVPSGVSEESIRGIEQLLREFKTGDAVGFLFAVMYRKRHYRVGMCGEAKANPTFSRGMLKALDDKLARRVSDD